MRPMKTHAVLALLGGTAIWLMPTVAAAQSADAGNAPSSPSTPNAPPSAAAAASSGNEIAEIVVTAQKRSERLQDVPASVSVVQASALIAQNLTRFQDYAAQIPGLSLTSARQGQTQVTIRGITTGPAQSASSTGFYIDEAPIGSVNAFAGGSSNTPDLDPSDLANIEVLKGPQGTLYGADSVGGLVKFVTSEPDFNAIHGRVSAGVNGAENGGTGYTFRGLVNLPVVTDALVVRVSGFDRRDPGYINNVNGRADSNYAKVYGGRALVAAKLGEHFRLDLSAILQDTKAANSNLEDVDGNLKPIYGTRNQFRYIEEPSKNSLRVYNGTLRGNFGQFDIVSSTTYQTDTFRSAGDGSFGYGALLGGLLDIPTLGVRTNNYNHTSRWSEEVRGDAKGLANLLDLQVGLYYTHENDQNKIPGFDPFSTTTGAAIALPFSLVKASISSEYSEYSAFGNATVHITPRFDILAGVRYSHDKQSYDQSYSGLIVNPASPATPLIIQSGEKGNIATFLVTPRYKITDTTMIYARVANGYRPGGPNAVPPTTVINAPTSFAPDKLISYEAGVKTSLFDRMLTIDAAGFYTNWKHIQIQTSAGGFNFFVNGGSARSQGGEITARLTPLKGLMFGFNGAYTDAHLSDAAPAAGGLKGDKLPFVPRWSGSLTADYTRSMGNDWSANVGGALNYTGKRISDYTGRVGREVPSYTTLNLHVGATVRNFDVSIFAKNAINSHGILSLTALGLVPGVAPLEAAIIQPRTFGAEVALKF